MCVFFFVGLCNQGCDIKLLTESLEFAMEPQINNEVVISTYTRPQGKGIEEILVNI